MPAVFCSFFVGGGGRCCFFFGGGCVVVYFFLVWGGVKVFHGVFSRGISRD